MGSTQNFGLERFGAEGRISDNNYKFSNRDRDTLDALLWTLINHDHRDTGSTATLAGPLHRPNLAVSTGGNMAAGVNLNYKVSFIDQYGNETEASTSGSITTPDPLPTPPVPALAYATTGGTLSPGIYRYALAYYDGIGTTRALNIASISIPTGTVTNTITITLGTLPTGATGWRIYRRGPGDEEYWLLNSVTTGPTYLDDGLDLALDCTKSRPTSNTTKSNNRVVVSIAPLDLPLDSRIVAWRIYRSSTIGLYGSSSLLATVTETTTESGTDLITSYTDVGSATFMGSPLSQTVVPPPIPQLDPASIFTGTGRLPAEHAPQGVNTHCTSCNGTIAVKTYNKFHVNEDMPVSRIDLFFQTAPTGLGVSDYLTFRISDNATQNTIQEVWNNSVQRNETQYVYNNATGGTFTLSDGVSTTAAIAYNATAETIATRLEADIIAIVDVAVSGVGLAVDPWVIEWVDPGNQNITYTLIANDTNLTGGTSSVTVGQNGSDGGTFTLTDTVDTTLPIAYNASAATIETRLETDITSIINVTVTGTGTQMDPWVIVFVNPGGQFVATLLTNSALLNGTAYVSTTTEGYSPTQINVPVNVNSAEHSWAAALTEFEFIEAEDALGDGGSVSDAFATNDVAIELTAQNHTRYWDYGTGLEAGDYVARFYVSVAPGATYQINVVDQIGPTTVATATVNDGSNYLPAHELYFTDTGGTEDWRFEVIKTDATAGVVRVDRFEYELRKPLLHKGATATVEFLVTGVPATNGNDVQATVWY